MLNDELMSRLSELNRVHLPAETAVDQPLTPRAKPPVVPYQNCEEDDLSQLPAGTEVENAWGSHWLRERPIADVWPDGEHWLNHRIDQLDQPPDLKLTRKADVELSALIDALPERAVYLDLETCGFAGSMVFLIGLIHGRDGQLVLSQLLARHYGEEKAMLQTFWHRVTDDPVLATFNGKSFDWPMLHDRSTLHHLGYSTHDSPYTVEPSSIPAKNCDALGPNDPRPELIHCDLLHHSRRRWKDKLPNCKLQTLEKYIFRRQRTNDIKGRAIPSAYHDFVRNGDAWLIRSVLHHNALDLVTLLQLSVCVAKKVPTG